MLFLFLFFLTCILVFFFIFVLHDNTECKSFNEVEINIRVVFFSFLSFWELFSCVSVILFFYSMSSIITSYLHERVREVEQVLFFPSFLNRAKKIFRMFEKKPRLEIRIILRILCECANFL